MIREFMDSWDNWAKEEIVLILDEYFDGKFFVSSSKKHTEFLYLIFSCYPPVGLLVTNFFFEKANW